MALTEDDCGVRPRRPTLTPSLTEEHLGILIPRCSRSFKEKEAGDIPDFWPDRPNLWFISLEAQLHSCNITLDCSRYYTLISRLTKDTLAVVESVIKNTPATGKFDKIKLVLLGHCAVSQEDKFWRLTSGLELGSKKPSTLLVEMSALAGDKLDPEYVRTLWLDRLPREMQLALAAAGALDNEHLGKLADSIVTIRHHITGQAIAAVDRHQTASSDQGDRVDELARQVSELTRLMHQQLRFRGRSPIRGESTIGKRKKSNDRGMERNARASGMCFYYARFKSRAAKCITPCAWKSNQKYHPT
ncbi:uncharacterized protein LOC128896461 [Hylaeus anthracinus]|uniref:uncharacterized protein LOC128896461 n=1 Tax=Hylaeus anthracinus TaxID=313031 RepID=UPI0023B974F0|nr:uncharacterized protein LOC128896461 [Hylaeus anthracinus]